MPVAKINLIFFFQRNHLCFGGSFYANFLVSVEEKDTSGSSVFYFPSSFPMWPSNERSLWESDLWETAVVGPAWRVEPVWEIDKHSCCAVC